MANLLIVDPDGRRRVALEAAAQQAGHRTYSAGSAAEALRLAAIYVPDALLLPDGLPDRKPADLLAALRSDAREQLRGALVVTPEALSSAGDTRLARARSARPDAMLAALEEGLAAAPRPSASDTPS